MPSLTLRTGHVGTAAVAALEQWVQRKCVCVCVFCVFTVDSRAALRHHCHHHCDLRGHHLPAHSGGRHRSKELQGRAARAVQVRCVCAPHARQLCAD